VGVENLVRLETRNANAAGVGQITIRDLIKSSLRMRPERIAVGEVRGGEALDMLQAMNTGHDGSLSTGHANSTQDMLKRLETMVLMGMDLPVSAIRGQIASGIDILVHLGRMRDRTRKVLYVDEINGMKDGEIQQIGSPTDIYNEPTNEFVAKFIGESNIIDGVMLDDYRVMFEDKIFDCVDFGFDKNEKIDVVIRPEDLDIVPITEGKLKGIVRSVLFKGVHYEMEVMAAGREWLVHSTHMFPVGTEVGIHVDPFNIQIMNKPESEDEEATVIEE